MKILPCPKLHLRAVNMSRGLRNGPMPGVLTTIAMQCTEPKNIKFNSVRVLFGDWKAITEGHNRRPEQKVTSPLGAGPPGPGTPPGADPPGTRHPQGDLLQGMLGYHLQCMLG